MSDRRITARRGGDHAGAPRLRLLQPAALGLLGCRGALLGNWFHRQAASLV
jgi:hypothetical protein